MKHPPSPGRLYDRARARMRKAAIRRVLRRVAAGQSHALPADLVGSGPDYINVLVKLVARMPQDSAAMARLQAAFKESGAVNAAIDGLASRDAALRVRSARILGALRVEPATGLLALSLSSGDKAVADASARALGRIGGARAAESLLQAIQRSGPRRILVVELARAAPDLFLEVALSGPRSTGVHAAAALASGLRRRQVSVGPLLALLVNGTRRQRDISCRALGWIGARTAIPLIEAALEDREWRVRRSAAKALKAMHAPFSSRQLEALLDDRHGGVRSEARNLLNRQERALATSTTGGSWR